MCKGNKQNPEENYEKAFIQRKSYLWLFQRTISPAKNGKSVITKDFDKPSKFLAT